MPMSHPKEFRRDVVFVVREYEFKIEVDLVSYGEMRAAAAVSLSADLPA